uniref:phosphoinositide 5-phosphatase n=1 Tax=Globodera rostochiensis TaxID=31243 RepID=A0A914HAX0_GLORO
MSLRNVRIHKKILGNGTSSVLVDSTVNEEFLLLQCGGVLTLSKDVGNALRQQYAKISDGYALLGIHRISAYEHYLVLVKSVLSVGQLFNCDLHKITNVQFVPLHGASSQNQTSEQIDARVVEMQKFLSAGIFYFSSSTKQNNYDLTHSLQRRQEKGDRSRSDFRFYWNRTLSYPFERFGVPVDNWLVKIICGSVLVRTIYVGHRTAKVALISRLSCDYVGTRFNVRGINDAGNVANFVETEQLLTFEEKECSFVQVRGSVPLFWEQPGINVGSHTIKLKPLEFSMFAMERHYTYMKQFYGQVLSVNLLGSKRGERSLSVAFQTALNLSKLHSDVRLVSFDYHSEVKQSKESVRRLISEIDFFIEHCNFFSSSSSLQRGVIRTNCLDCLDRTNSVQTLIGMRALITQLKILGVEQFKANIVVRFEEVARDLWQKNGDNCSIIYAGTGALEGKSKLKDASRSLVRTIQNNLMDASKQESIDLLLLGHLFGDNKFDKLSNVLPSSLLKASSYFFEYSNIEGLVEREKEMCSVKSLRVFVGTWNVNGGRNIYNVAFKENHSLDLWLYPLTLLDADALNFDLIAVGFEEIVDLNASNLMKASTTNQRIWRDGLRRTIDRFQHAHFSAVDDKFVVLACEQLVGVCLVLFIRASLLGSVRDLAIGDVKTGMGGATGNKGSVAVRMTFDSTSICFVCSHFAAGQNEVTTRNADFQTTMKKIRFPMGRTISSHDVVFWMGDFNYRISLPGEEVKNAIRQNNFAYLSEHDQLSQQKEAGNVFAEFTEGPLHFAPTYKYDTFSDDYDTSDKCRSPAWTDRVLWMDSNNFVQLIYYGRSELKTSDHRPVFAIFQLNTLKFELQKAEPLLKDAIISLGPPNSTIVCAVSGHPTSFPQRLCNAIFSKIYELGITILVSKLEGRFLHVQLGSGMDALMALSMDGVVLGEDLRLEVSLGFAGCWPDSLVADLEQCLSLVRAEVAQTSTEEDSLGWAALNLNVAEDSDEEGDELLGNGQTNVLDDFSLIDFSDVTPK